MLGTTFDIFLLTEEVRSKGLEPTTPWVEGDSTGLLFPKQHLRSAVFHRLGIKMSIMSNMPMFSRVERACEQILTRSMLPYLGQIDIRRKILLFLRALYNISGLSNYSVSFPEGCPSIVYCTVPIQILSCLYLPLFLRLIRADFS